MSIKQTGEFVRFNYTGGIQEFVIPVAGLYKLEVWGAQGGNGASRYAISGIGGRGGYSLRYVEFAAKTKLYICVGGQGEPGRLGYNYAEGGYNGGGHGGDNCFGGANMAGGGGGGATHIASVSGLLQALASYKDNIYIVAGGGGGGSGFHDDPYDEEEDSREDYFSLPSNSWDGGGGGGFNGVAGGGGTYQFDKGKPGTQTSPGTGGSFGKAGINYSPYAGGGGGGWYGGGYGSQEAPGGGGSGYIGSIPTITYKGKTYTSSTISGYNSGNGSAMITLMQKASPPIYLGTKEISAIYFGTREITDIKFHDQ